MASIARRPDGTYRPRYRDEHGKEHARHFKRKVDAQRWLDEVTAAVQTGTYVDPKRPRTTVGELADVWLTGKINLKPTSRARYADVLKDPCPAALGEGGADPGDPRRRAGLALRALRPGAGRGL